MRFANMLWQQFASDQHVFHIAGRTISLCFHIPHRHRQQFKSNHVAANAALSSPVYRSLVYEWLQRQHLAHIYFKSLRLIHGQSTPLNQPTVLPSATSLALQQASFQGDESRSIDNLPATTSFREATSRDNQGHMMHEHRMTSI
jgi:hypothetical protein